jgi:hypothetical protein
MLPPEADIATRSHLSQEPVMRISTSLLAFAAGWRTIPL